MFKNALKTTAFVSTLLMSFGICSTAKADAATVTGRVNFREGASIKYKSKGKLLKGENVEVLGKSNDWYKLKNRNGEIGWSHSKYIDATQEEVDQVSTKNSGVVKVSLNFRKGPSLDETIISVFQKGEELKILSENDGWYKVETKDGTQGWVYAKYIEISGNNQESQKDDTNGIYTDTANVRKGASTRYSVIDTLKEGTKVKVISSLDGWYKVKCPSGEIGWTHSSHIDSTVPAYQSTTKKETTTSSSSSKNPVSISSLKDSTTSKSGKQMVVSATAYSGDTITATGTTPKWGTIAVDPKVIPYGTKVYIPRFGKTFIAEDCGGGIKGNKIDIFMNSEASCNDWGVRTITIEILD